MELSKRELGTALRRLARAVTEANEQRNRIYEHCMEVYGCEPSEVDNDQFIDACDGGSGSAPGMSADEFDESMRLAIERSGRG